MVDFTALANTANRLITNTPGREIEVIKLDSTPADAALPWRGAADARATPAASAIVRGVFVPFTGSGFGRRLESMETLIGRTEQVILIAPGPTSTDRLDEFDEVIDADGSRWKITFAEVLNPGSALGTPTVEVRLLYALGVKR